MTASRVVRSLFVTLLVVLGFAPLAVQAQEASPVAGGMSAGTELVASGLTNPRGMTWGADGTLFVALAGSGGPNAPTETLPGSDLEATFRGGLTGAVASIDASGCPVLIAGGMPSTMTPNGDALGAEDVAILGDQLYAAVDGGGAMHGNVDTPSGVYRLIEGGSSELIADLSAWSRANPSANPDLTHDFDAGGYSILAMPDANVLWVSDPNSGQIVSVTPDGVITRVADLSEGHPVLTKMALAPQGGVYVGTLTAVPFPDGAARVIHVALDGTVEDVWTGLTAVVDVGVGADGTLYALEMSIGNLTEPPFLVPGSGRIVHQTGPDTFDVVVDGLMLPIALDMGPDGAWYVALPAIGAGGGEGTIMRLVTDGGTPAAAGGASATCAPLPETLASAEGSPPAASTPAASQEQPPAAEQPAAEAAVTIEGFAFGPQTLEITAGTTVTWTNNDSASHTATATDGSWDTGNLDTGASGSITFDTPGTYTYVCAYHPSMTGTIIVT
jgi:plastocyanin